MAIAYVSHEPGTVENTASSTKATAFPGNVIAGNLLIAAISYYNPAGTISVSSIADSRSNTWALAYGPVTVSSIGGDWSFEVWRAYNNASTGANTVTVTYSASVAEGRGCSVSEFSGLATSSAQDQEFGQQQVNPGTATDGVSSGTVGPIITANQLIYGATMALPYNTITEGTGYTTLGNTGNSGTYNRNAAEYKIVSATGTQAATFTSNDNTTDTATIIVTFMEPAAGGGGPIIGGGSITTGSLIRGGRLTS